MNKFFSFLAIATSCLGISACGDASYEAHETRFNPMLADGIKFYADQTFDTIQVISLDSWTAKAIDRSNYEEAKWFSISPDAAKSNGQQYSVTKISISLQPNTTEEERSGLIRVNAYHQVSMLVTQYNHLRIMRPEQSTLTSGNKQFILPIKNSGGADSITVYNYQPNAKVVYDQAEGNWISKIDTCFNTIGAHTIRLNVNRNATGTERSTNILFKSNGVTTPIIIKQKK